jgi:hypothetical protein
MITEIGFTALTDAGPDATGRRLTRIYVIATLDPRWARTDHLESPHPPHARPDFEVSE